MSRSSILQLAIAASLLGLASTVWWYRVTTADRNAHQAQGECCVGFTWQGFAQYTVIDCHRWVPCDLLVQPPPSPEEPVG
jgi:hypothetical protein